MKRGKVAHDERISTPAAGCAWSVSKLEQLSFIRDGLPPDRRTESTKSNGHVVEFIIESKRSSEGDSVVEHTGGR